MNTFKINRFWKVFTRLLLVRRREMTKWFLTMSGIMLFILLVSAHVWDFSPYTKTELFSHYLPPLTPIASILLILTLNFGCYITHDLEKKQARISELMLPGSKLEKYIARIIYCSVVFMIIVVLALGCADFLQQSITMIVHRGVRVSIIGIYYDEFSRNNDIWTLLFIYPFINSVAILGGVIFRKAAWLKTWIAVGIIMTIALFVIFLFITYIYTKTNYEIYSPFSKEQLKAIVDVILVVVSFVLYWLAYKIYNKMQVINNRWVNL